MSGSQASPRPSSIGDIKSISFANSKAVELTVCIELIGVGNLWAVVFAVLDTVSIAIDAGIASVTHQIVVRVLLIWIRDERAIVLKMIVNKVLVS